MLARKSFFFLNFLLGFLNHPFEPVFRFGRFVRIIFEKFSWAFHLLTTERWSWISIRYSIIFHFQVCFENFPEIKQQNEKQSKWGISEKRITLNSKRSLGFLAIFSFWPKNPNIDFFWCNQDENSSWQILADCNSGRHREQLCGSPFLRFQGFF